MANYNTKTLTFGASDVIFTFRDDDNMHPEHHGRAIQNFAYSTINNNWIYTTQRWNQHTVLSKYERGSNPLRVNMIGQIGLIDFGHGETLETVYLDELNREYIWIGSNCDTTDTSHYWSTQISRLILGSDMNIQEIKKLCDFKYANKNGTSLHSGNVTRVMACISNDKTRICFKINFGSSIPYFAIYDFAILNSRMNSSTEPISMKNMKDICIAAFSGQRFSVFQSMDMGNNNELFVSSGNCNSDKPVDNMISKYIISGSITSLPSPSSSVIVQFTEDFGYGKYDRGEIEGIKCYGSNISFTTDFKINAGQEVADNTSAIRTPLILINKSEVD